MTTHRKWICTSREIRPDETHFALAFVDTPTKAAELTAEHNRLHDAWEKAEAMVNTPRPEGWELDATPEELRDVWSKNRMKNLDDWTAVCEFCRSRIRPTFECKKCDRICDWTLDVTAEDINRWWHENISTSHDVWPGEANSLIEYFKSRIRPVYECRECEKNKLYAKHRDEDIAALRADIAAARKALEGGEQ